jgi:hypothetical protein
MKEIVEKMRAIVKLKTYSFSDSIVFSWVYFNPDNREEI